jgi:pilus assembly protein CpaC
MSTLPKSAIKRTIFLLLIAISYCLPAIVSAALMVDKSAHKTLELTVGSSVNIRSSRAIKRISIADPAIADFLMISPSEIYLTGKGAGKSTLTIWEGNKVTEIYDLHVGFDITRLKQQLNQILPEEQELRIISGDDSIILAGRVSSAGNLAQVLSIAEAFAPKGKIRNQVEVAGVQEVMLEVRVAEMSKRLTRELGFNIIYRNKEEFGIGLLNQIGTLAKTGSGNLPEAGAGVLSNFFVSPASNLLFRFNRGSSSWTTLIDALRDDGMVKILAEPTLIALSGQSAQFLAGGEYPVPVPQGLGTVGIEYKKYGVELGFTPTVLSENKINIRVNPSVSELDYSTAVVIEGFVVPGLTTRSASTIVELADGQSFAIAGLLSESMRENVAKYPALGDIPILGQLFRSQNFRRNESELVIIVTPRLVKPLDPNKQTLPTDFFVESDDFEFYVLGMLEGRGCPTSSNAKGQLDGDFGHAVPMN